MNPKKNQKTDKKRQEDNHSLTETLQKSENRQGDHRLEELKNWKDGFQQQSLKYKSFQSTSHAGVVDCF